MALPVPSCAPPRRRCCSAHCWGRHEAGASWRSRHAEGASASSSALPPTGWRARTGQPGQGPRGRGHARLMPLMVLRAQASTKDQKVFFIVMRARQALRIGRCPFWCREHRRALRIGRCSFWCCPASFLRVLVRTLHAMCVGEGTSTSTMQLLAGQVQGGARFRVWAPGRQRVQRVPR